MSPHVGSTSISWNNPSASRLPFSARSHFTYCWSAAVIGVGWVQSRNTISLGDPNGGRLGAVAVTPLSSIALPSHAGPKNPVATIPQSAVPTPVSKAKPAPKVKAPDPKAIPIPSRNAKLTRPSPGRRAARQVARAAEGPAQPGVQHRGHAGEYARLRTGRRRRRRRRQQFPFRQPIRRVCRPVAHPRRAVLEDHRHTRPTAPPWSA